MYLTSTNLVHYLLACGHVARHTVVHTPFSVFEIDGHHRSFRVNVAAGAGLFVKQLKTPDEHSIDCLRREACCYRLAWSDSQFVAWQQLMPRLIRYDPDRHLIIVQQIVDAEDLVHCHRRLGSFPMDLARLLGTALADVHNTVPEFPREDGSHFHSSPPWIFRFHDQNDNDASPAVKQLASTLRDEQALSRQLTALHAFWSPELLIHGDLKWNNCLVSPTSDDKPQLHLVDWEMASWGDPLWDVAGGLAGYLVEPILKGSQYGAGRPTTLEDAEFLALVQPPMQSLWQAYCQRVNLAPAPATEQAVRCMCYLGARLLVAIIEYHPPSNTVELSESFRVLLEAGRTLLRDPSAMAALLLGGKTD